MCSQNTRYEEMRNRLSNIEPIPRVVLQEFKTAGKIVFNPLPIIKKVNELLSKNGNKERAD